MDRGHLGGARRAPPAEHHHDQAVALLREAADEYVRLGRRPDKSRCRVPGLA